MGPLPYGRHSERPHTRVNLFSWAEASIYRKAEGQEEILSREEVLQIVSEMARKGSVTAAVALERILRHQPVPDELDDEPDRLLRRDY